MEQRKRLGGSGGLGYYTSWEKATNNGCIYCGDLAITREHVPSKVFLEEPYPDNLPTIPACFACNNGYSEDEKYVAYFLDILKKCVYSDYSVQNQECFELIEDKKLQETLQEQIKVMDGKVFYQADEKRFGRILLKLARGHAGFELDYVDFDNANMKMWFDFSFNMTANSLLDFALVPTIDIAPEVGSRGLFIVQNEKTGDAMKCFEWQEVQEGRYRYQVSFNTEGNILVKIVIYELLFCRVQF